MKTRCISGVAGALALSAAITLFAQTPGTPWRRPGTLWRRARHLRAAPRHLLAAPRRPLAVVAAAVACHSGPRPWTPRPISRSKWCPTS